MLAMSTMYWSPLGHYDREPVSVQHLGLGIPRDHQDDITSDAVLQGPDLVAERGHNGRG